MNYNEKFSEIARQLAENLRTSKTDDDVRFSYKGVGYDVGDRTARIQLIKCISHDYMTEHAAYVQAAIDRWCEEGAKGQRPVTPDPNIALLERLSDAILDEELTDPSRSKTFNEEYPFLSERQFERRRDREYSLSLAENYDLDGVNRAKPERRHRIAKEERFIDKVSHRKNRRRNAQYRKDTSPGPVKTEISESFVNCRGIGKRWKDELSLVY